MSFIDKTVSDLLQKKLDFSKTHLILPNKRPIIFFRECFANKGYNGFLPTFITIEDFFLAQSSLTKIEAVPLWLEAFEVQKKFVNPDEKLEDFLKWIPTILNDFNEMDIHAQNTLKVLQHLASIERIENWGANLHSETEEKLFYKNVKFWQNNIILYQELVKHLKNKGFGTKGMIEKEIFENLEKIKLAKDETFIFAGLNSLTPKEERLIKHIALHAQTLLYWDMDEYYVKNPNQEAGDFFRKYQKWQYYQNKEPQWISNEFSKPKNINIVGVSQEVSQAKYAGNLLKSLSQEDLQNTALVLCDETLLPAVMESIPENIDKLNITMGFLLKNTVLAAFFKQVFRLHVFQEKNKSKGFYYQDVINVLENPLTKNSDAFLLSQFIEEIKEKNIVFITDSLIYEKLSAWEMFFIFKNYDHPADLIHKLQKLCFDKFWQTDDSQPILKETLLSFKELFDVFIHQLNDNKEINSFSLLQVLYQNLLNNERISFIGEPLEGLQILGLLETRLLSFKNVIMLSVNEGTIPVGRNENSFVPFDVKKNFEINTFLENDAVYAYHFYRLLQHAENIQLIYNNFTEGLHSGEKSRFISQLEFESQHPVNERIAYFSGQIQKQQDFTIEKTPAVMKEIHRWLAGKISPTHLTNYHYNPIGFYFQRVIGFKMQQDIEEEISLLNYGNLIHHTLEALYQPLKNSVLSEKKLKELLKSYPSHLEDYIKKNLNSELFKQGQNYLQKLLAEKTVEKIIRRDLEDIKGGNEIFLRDIEREIESSVVIENIGNVRLKGFIDRWDVFNGIDRVIDYKTSTVGTLNFPPPKSPLQESKDFKFFIQLVFYAYMVLNENQADRVMTGIWNFKKPFRGMEPLKYEKNEIFDLPQMPELFKNVTEIIQEIANPEIPFVEKDYKRF
ncbi:MAG: PD-(D/E)XK nuclease family protein [Flavobacteriaceae bacterium]|jgi:hypothetical protein|nr:PD-(D/E)XK nuclease family protein [Flavobacteriaceae bacterium]